MSTLFNKLSNDLVAARKARQESDVLCLSTMVGELETLTKRTGKPVTDADVISLAKKSKEGVESILAIGEAIGISWEKEEAFRDQVRIYETYIPHQLTDDEYRDIILSLESKTMKDVQAFFKANYQGRYDAKRIAEFLK